MHTVRAMRHVTDEFDGLNLHDRLAIIVPDAQFAEQLRPLLARHLHAEFVDTRQFMLVTAADASAACSFKKMSQGQSGGAEWIVFDEMEQLDGLERLICVCVGLDAAVGLEQSGTLEVRSMLYRAMTRAHMMVLVVNEFIAGGWFEFLTTVRLQEDKKFDAEKIRREAQSADAKIAEAQRLRREHEAQAETALLPLIELSSEAKTFMRSHIVSQLQRGTAFDVAVESAKRMWDEQQREIAREESQRAQAMYALGTRDQLGEDERSFLHECILAALRQGTDIDTALSDADKQWFERMQLQRVPELVASATARAGVDSSLCPIVGKIAKAKLRRITAAEEV